MPDIGATTELSDIEPGQSYAISVTGHNGHTTELEFQADDDTWNAIPDTSATTDFSGVIMSPTGKMRLTITGGTGNVNYSCVKAAPLK